MPNPLFHTVLRLSFLGFLCFGSGCAHRVMIDSDPPGATIRVGKKMVGVTPKEVEFTWVPFKKLPVHIKSPGRRWLTIYVQKDVGPLRLFWQSLTLQFGKLLGKKPRAYHRAHFVRQHGPAGTWAPEEAK